MKSHPYSICIKFIALLAVAASIMFAHRAGASTDTKSSLEAAQLAELGVYTMQANVTTLAYPRCKPRPECRQSMRC